MTTRERLGMAAVVSLALHGLVISGTWVLVPQPRGEPGSMEVRLGAPVELKPAVPKPKIRAARLAVPVTAPPVPTIAAASPIVLPEPEPEATPAEDVATPPTAPEPPRQVALAAETSVAAATHNSVPRKVRISYTLLYGSVHSPVGRSVLSWEAETSRESSALQSIS